MTSADVRGAACNGVMMQRDGVGVELIPHNGVSPICPHFAARYVRAPSRSNRLQLKKGMQMSSDGKDGMCAIVTGSASGLGAATAAILARGGARIVVNYASSQKEAEQTADLCRAAGG